MPTSSRYKVTQPAETRSVGDQGHVIYEVGVCVIDVATGETVREFRSRDTDDVRAAFRAVDEMLEWLKNRTE